MAVSDDVLNSIAAALKQPLGVARHEGYSEGCRMGRLFAIQSLEAEVARLVKDGKADGSDAAHFARAAGWLRRNSET